MKTLLAKLTKYTVLAEITCGQPPEVANATFTSEGYLFEDIAFYSSENGFEVSDGVTEWNETCQSDKMWSKNYICTSKVSYAQIHQCDPSLFSLFA